jgi:hypothetical protein
VETGTSRAGTSRGPATCRARPHVLLPTRPPSAPPPGPAAARTCCRCFWMRPSMWSRLNILLNGMPSGSGPVRPVTRLKKSVAMAAAEGRGRGGQGGVACRRCGCAARPPGGACACVARAARAGGAREGAAGRWTPGARRAGRAARARRPPGAPRRLPPPAPRPRPLPVDPEGPVGHDAAPWGPTCGAWRVRGRCAGGLGLWRVFWAFAWSYGSAK